MLAKEVYFSDGVAAIRPMWLSEVDDVVKAARESIEDVQQWMSWMHDDYSAEDVNSWFEALPEAWERGSVFSFAIVDDHSKAFVGGVNLNSINNFHRLGNIGYWVRSSRHGQGFAGRAARLVARFSFEKVGLLRAEIVVAVGNSASLRAAEKSGAIREGVLRNRVVIREQVYDAVMHSLISQDLGLEPEPNILFPESLE
jgi:ribosomal-protein-serine acetyltransferase